MAFGGAGPLHACEVAQELGIQEVIIPPHPGTLCSLGLLLADTKFDLSRTRILDAAEENLSLFNDEFEAMVLQGMEALDREKIPQERRLFEFSIDMRYQRQNFEISIPVPSGVMSSGILQQVLADFHAEHRRSYGYCNENAPVQFVSYRVSAIGIIDKPDMHPSALCTDVPLPSPIEMRRVLYQGKTEYQSTPIYVRDDLLPGHSITGPCICEQMDTTLVVPPNWTLQVDGYGNIVIHYSEVK